MGVCWVARIRKMYEETCFQNDCSIFNLHRLPSPISQRYAFHVQMSREDLCHPNLYISYISRPRPSPNGQAKRLQSHRPSAHPVLHLSSHLEQSNRRFPSFSLTSLWASHIHLPNPSLPSTLGSFPLLLIHSRKSSAHDQHGYNFPKSCKNCRISDCCVGSATGG